MDSTLSNILLVTQINWSVISGTIMLLVLLVLSAVVSGSEVAFFSLSKSDFDENLEDNPSQKLVHDLLQNPKKLLATVLIANNFINILFILTFTFVGNYFF